MSQHEEATRCLGVPFYTVFSDIPEHFEQRSFIRACVRTSRRSSSFLVDLCVCAHHDTLVRTTTKKGTAAQKTPIRDQLLTRILLVWEFPCWRA
jgi:hypothetical protein